MLRDEVLEKLRSDKETLDAFGVKIIGVFGSVARDEEAPDNDVDIVVDFKEDAIPGLLECFRLKRHLEEVFGRQVDLVTPGSPNQRIDARIESETLYA